MPTFLSKVAADIMARHGDHLDRIAVVFPNKRASLFLNQELTRLAGRPVWSPAYITISELFRKQSRLTEADPLFLVTILHRIFVEATGSVESIDNFWGWGETMLADFDDIDKHLIDAGRVLKNITDLRELDSLDYLTSEQRELLQQFFSTFSDAESSLQSSFRRLWCRLGDIYGRFKAELMAKGIAYEGMLYRDVVDIGRYDLPYDSYVFVGFNLLQEVEQKLFEAVKQAGKAEFYWDYDHAYMAKESPFFEAGQFIGRHIEPQRFPCRLSADDEIYSMASRRKHIEYVSTVSNTLQASYVAQWLCQTVETTGSDGQAVRLKRHELGSRCAVVLCDETLLPGVLGSLPAQMGKLNVTIGFPLQHSPAASLVADLLALRLEGSRHGGREFRLKHVARLLRHPYTRLLSGRSGEVLGQLLREKRFWSDAEWLIPEGDNGLQLLFGQIEQGEEVAATPPLSGLIGWCMEVVHAVGVAAGDADPLMLESLYRMHTLLGRLQSLMADGTLKIDSGTMRRLIDRLVASASVPFHGEPAEGVQIMGVLETRNLDFEQVLVLSASDDKMPNTSSQASFVPYNVRKAYGLTVADDQVSIYAYYFYRLLQRARSATLCYNTDAGDRGQGEMSRFMMQLLVGGNNQIEMRELSFRAEPVPHGVERVDKSAAVMDILRKRTTYSPTELGQYMRCPLSYYYINVLGLREPESAEDEIENTDFGTIFHYSMEIIYRQLTGDLARPVVAKSQIEEFLKRRGAVERIVDKAFADKFFFKGLPDGDAGETRRRRLPELNGLQVINHSAVCAYVRRTLKSDMATAPFAIRGLEERNLNLEIGLTDGTTLRIRGSIDRLDETQLADGTHYLRVIDYKTGRNADTEPKDMADIFNLAADPKWHPQYYLQAMLYSLAVATDKSLNPKGLAVRPALLFVSSGMERRIDPVLRIDKQPISSASDYTELIIGGVRSLLDEIRDASKPFLPTQFGLRCSTCAFAQLCKE